MALAPFDFWLHFPRLSFSLCVFCVIEQSMYSSSQDTVGLFLDGFANSIVLWRMRTTIANAVVHSGTRNNL